MGSGPGRDQNTTAIISSRIFCLEPPSGTVRERYQRQATILPLVLRSPPPAFEESKRGKSGGILPARGGFRGVGQQIQPSKALGSQKREQAGRRGVLVSRSSWVRGRDTWVVIGDTRPSARPEPRVFRAAAVLGWHLGPLFRLPAPLSQPPTTFSGEFLIKKYSCPYKNLCSGDRNDEEGLRNCQSRHSRHAWHTIQLDHHILTSCAYYYLSCVFVVVACLDRSFSGVSFFANIKNT